MTPPITTINNYALKINFEQNKNELNSTNLEPISIIKETKIERKSP
jgi:hypothetical protein